MAGTYHGLYSGDSPLLTEMGPIAVTISAGGRFTGRFGVKGKKVPFSGTFSFDVIAIGTATRVGLESRPIYDGDGNQIGSETFQRQVEFAVDPDSRALIGSVTSYEGETSFYAVAKRPASHVQMHGFNGRYTLRFSAGSLPGHGTFGHGFATLSVSNSGSTRMAGRLADGSRFTHSAVIGGSGEFPFHASFHRGQTAAMGWLIVFDTFDAASKPSDVEGDVVWKSDLPTVVKPRNFLAPLDTQLTVDGSRFSTSRGAPIVDVEEPTARLSGGDLLRPINKALTIGRSKITSRGKPANFTLSASASSGAISGRFFNPATGRKTPFRGVILQKQKVAAGFFLGANHSGKFTLAPPEITSIGFDHPDSNVLAIILPLAEGEPTLVQMRDSSAPGVRRLVFSFDDGTVIEMVSDSADRLAELSFGAHRFVFSDYTSSNVKRTYHHPDGTTTVDYVTLPVNAPAAAARMTLQHGAGEGDSDPEPKSIDEEVDENNEWVANPFNYYLPANTWLLVGQFIGSRVEKLNQFVNKLVEKGTELIPVLTNPLIDDAPTPRDAGQTAAQKGPQLAKEVANADPDAQTTAGFKVTETGIRPIREEWDPLVRAGKIDTSFTMEDVPCEESVFAEMNPECPQYIPPAPLKADSASMGTPTDTALSGTLRGSAADYFRVVAQPAHGSVTILDRVAGTFRYQPKPGYEGPDSFSFVAVNKSGCSSPGVVTIEVGSVTARDLRLKTQVDKQITGKLPATRQDYFELVRSPSEGTLTEFDEISGAFKYAPKPGFVGGDTFSFVAVNQFGRSEEAVVYITITSGPEDSNECLEYWKPLVLGTWKVVDHPFLIPGRSNEHWENWTLTITHLDASRVYVVEKYEQVWRDGERNPVSVGTVYWFLHARQLGPDGIHLEEPAMCCLSPVNREGSWENWALISGGTGSLVIRYNSQFNATLEKQ